MCPLASLGITWCPGCGLGRAIACIFHGDFLQSFKFHWFGIPAIVFLSFRIAGLSKKTLVYFANKPK
ncbi:DUF2752 domain-containing protein [Pararcticibacter amylolyticus]|uniref:DUF2752 domain-containing protein n=1 Tax=Pararcticibacter amylolyticus TaxID=2173175 RepID=UPI001EE4C39B|nr:DUF2752 domain-containing protein [Pararcticibacter amylolyticus]